jgi:hypothetical protein
MTVLSLILLREEDFVCPQIRNLLLVKGRVNIFA